MLIPGLLLAAVVLALTLTPLLVRDPAVKFLDPAPFRHIDLLASQGITREQILQDYPSYKDHVKSLGDKYFTNHRMAYELEQACTSAQSTFSPAETEAYNRLFKSEQ